MTASPPFYEDLSLRAWPALVSETFKGCVYRYADGYTYRANSAQVLSTEPRDYPLVINFAEAFYGGFQQPCLFKLTSGMGQETLDALLAERGYEKTRESDVLHCDLLRYETTGTAEVTIDYGITQDWFAAHTELSGVKRRDHEAAWGILSRVKGPVVAASIQFDGETAACGFGALENQYVGFFDIVVKKELRGRGMGRRLMTGLMAESKRQGASRAYLQVLSDNAPAKSLYRSLGFGPAYPYWYRKRG